MQPLGGCVTCGAELPPRARSGGAPKRYCQKCADDRRRERQRVHVPAEAVAVAAPPDEQMARLFRNYQARDSITIDKRPDGTRLVILSDAQIPFIDEPLLAAVLRFVDDFKPNDLIINGDWIDAYEISDFDKRPQRLFDLQTEFEQAGDTIDDLRSRIAPKGKVWWIDGNHEERINRTIWRHAQGFAFMAGDIVSGLALEARTAGYVPYGKHIDYLGFTVTHGNYVSQHSAYTAKKHADRYHSSGCNGHTHRAGSYSYRDGRGKSHTWFEIGCLCRMDLEYVRGVANWQQAFMCGTVMNGALHTQLVRVIETAGGRGFMVEGKFYKI